MQNKITSTPINPFTLSDGAIEGLKWLGLLLMTLDHVNHFLLSNKSEVFYALGRMAFPLFGFVLAYNLARTNAIQNGSHHRAMKRLFFFGLLASPFFMLLKGRFELNILFSLLLSTYLIGLIEQKPSIRTLLWLLIFLIGGLAVEYAWFAPSYCLAAWWFCKSPNTARGLLWLAATLLLWFTNLNYWACAALPVILLAAHFKLHISRVRYVFYAYYPFHLALLLVLQLLKSGD